MTTTNDGYVMRSSSGGGRNGGGRPAGGRGGSSGSGRSGGRDFRGSGNSSSGGGRDSRGSSGAGGGRDSRGGSGGSGGRDYRGNSDSRDSRGGSSSGGGRDYRGSSDSRDSRGGGTGGRDYRGSGGSGGGSRGGSGGGRDSRDFRGGGGSNGGSSSGQRSSGAGKPVGRSGPRSPRSRELDARLEAANRARYADRPVETGPRPSSNSGEEDGVRLQKVLAQAGLGSRRSCEEMIDKGRVEVNGTRVREQGVRVHPERDEIRVDGLTVETQGFLFFALNKPAGVVSTMEDPEGRQNLGDYVDNRETRLFHVGRLDTETEGLILLTNHGELSHRLTHPRYGVKKTYLASVIGPIPRDLGKQLKEGVILEDGLARADHFRIVQNTGKNYLVEITLHEGRKHIVRRMLEETGFPVERLVRTKFGPIALGDQKSGWLRRLTNTEVGMLKAEVGL